MRRMRTSSRAPSASKLHMPFSRDDVGGRATSRAREERGEPLLVIDLDSLKVFTWSRNPLQTARSSSGSRGQDVLGLGPEDLEHRGLVTRLERRDKRRHRRLGRLELGRFRPPPARTRRDAERDHCRLQSHA